MKKCLLLGIGLTFAVSSCTTIQNTASSDQVDTRLYNLTVADMKVADHHVTKTIEWKWNPFTLVSMEAQKKNAVAEAVREADADLLVEPQYTVKTRGLFRGGSVTVTGRPAKYTHFRSLTQADAINMAVSQGKPVVETRTVAVTTTEAPQAKTNGDALKVKAPSWNHSGITINAGIGGYVLRDGDDVFATEVALGYRKYFGAGFSWQVLKFGFNTTPKSGHFWDAMNFRITTGARYDSPRFDWLKNRSLYLSGDLGYCISRHQRFHRSDNGGFTFDVSGGVKLSRKFSLGVFYQRMNAEVRSGYDSHIHPRWGMVGARLELQF